MLYQLKQGKTEESILEQCQRLNRPLPKAIAEAPELHMGLELYYRAFSDLTTCRTLGMGLGPIPWSAIHEYAVLNGFSEEQREDLFFYLGQMDIAYLDYNSPKMSNNDGPKKPSKPFRRKPS